MKVLEKALKKALTEFFQSKEGIEIMYRVINNALIRECKYEDGKSEPGKVIEKTTHINVLNSIMEYLPGVEGAIRGCQADSASARNRAVEARNQSVQTQEMLLKAISEFNNKVIPYIRGLETGQNLIQMNNADETVYKIEG